LILQISPDLDAYTVAELEKDMQDLVKQQAKGFSAEDLRKTLKLFLEAEKKIKYSDIPQLPLEIAIIESCGTPA
jgi:DNA polymerase III delta subunit